MGDPSLCLKNGCVQDDAVHTIREPN